MSLSVPSMPTRITSTRTSPSPASGSATSRTAPLPSLLGITVSARTSAEYVVVPIEPSEVERVFREAGALRDGHFILSSGKHSPRYLEKFQVLQHPRDTERLAAAIAEWARTSEVETVAGPTTGGIILAHEVARQLGARAIYAERRDGASGREFRRGFALAPGARVLVGDDIMTTGGSRSGTIDAGRAQAGTVAAAEAL